MSDSSYWHLEPPVAEGGQPHKAVFDTASNIENAQRWRAEAQRSYATLYKDRLVSGFAPGKWRFSTFSLTGDSDGTGIGRPLTYNVIRSCTDTAVAKICLSRPMPRYLPSNANEDLAGQAKRVELYVWGVFMRNDAWTVAAHAYRDAILYGDGYLYVRSENGQIIFEAVHPSSILVDDNAAINGVAQTMFKRDWWDRSQLLAIFPEQREVIENAPRDHEGSDGQLRRDLIKVVEAWELPRGDFKGRHVVAIENAALVDEEWDCPRFPIVHLTWSRDLAGYHGTGLAEELHAIQLEINATLAKISGNMEHLAVPYIAKPRSSNVNDEHLLTNLPYRLLEYDGGVPPAVMTPPAVNEQVFSYLETLYRRAFEITGISMLSATSQKPSGLYSNAALISYLDVETQRFSQQARQWEQIFVELSKRTTDCAQRTDDLKGVNVVDSKASVVERIEASDLDLDLDETLVEVQIYPASSLPKTLSGRAQLAIELVQGGVFDRTQAAAVLGDMHPDIDKHTRLDNAPWDDLCATFEHMLSTGEYVEPLEYQDCKLGIRLATRYWCRARLNGASEDRYGLLEAWMGEAAKLLSVGKGAPPEPPTPPPQPGPRAAMPAMPAPPPMPVPMG